jgi:hypothetical protein
MAAYLLPVALSQWGFCGFELDVLNPRAYLSDLV